MASNLRVDSIVPATGSSVSIGTATGGVNIPGVLTYEDVTNVDSVGVITARQGIRIGGGTTVGPSSGIVTYFGDGSQLTGITALSGSTDNTVCTVTGANAIQGEANMTFDGSTLTLTPGSSAGNVTSLVLGRTSSAPAAQTTAVVTGGIPVSGVPGIFFGSTNTNLPAIGFQTPNSSNGHIAFSPKGSERARITSDGRLLIGRTSNSTYDNLLQTKSITVETDGDTTGMHFNRTDSNAAWVAMRFYAQGSQSGYIQINTSSTQYSTSSDYRLKENAVSISDGIARLKTLKPYKFNFIEDATKTVDGFFAHEVTAVPEAVNGEKDAVDKDGNPDYQVIDHSKLVPLLTAALQEEIVKREEIEAKYNALEARISALEGL